MEQNLTTVEALHRLYEDIEKVLHDYQAKQDNRRSRKWLTDTLHHKSRYTTLHWITISLLLFEALVLFLLYFFLTPVNISLATSGIIILSLVSINLYLVMSDNRSRHHEIPKRVLAILATLKLAIEHVKWLPENYPHLCTPFSPCVTMQWVYRDGSLVNLPWALLVRGDIIVIRPGQLSPGLCESLDEGSDCPILHPKEIYGPPLPNANEIFSVPKGKIPLKNKLYLLKETPFLNNLRIALERSLRRPVTHFNQQRYLLVNNYLEMCTFPIVLICTVVLNLIRCLYLSEYVGYTHWADLFVIQPIKFCLPLLPLLFPMLWICLNALGMARFKALFNTTSKKAFAVETDPYTETEQSMNLDLDFSYRWTEVWDIFLNIITGKEMMMTRSANILHVFGHLSALCVVDKKGILSCPNPTAEKIFFLRSAGSSSQASSMDSMADSAGDADSITVKPKAAYNIVGKGTVTEVLDMTHNHNVPFKLEFDDHEWKQHLHSLKPLGLAILLNTCNMNTQENYSQFCSHITCEAMYNENLVPVTNRRCLCELSKQIGFMDEAENLFHVEEQVSTFRHLTDMVKRDKFARALHLTTKLKFPFPHMVAVVIKELNSGSHQLFSQGTADIILDSCVDYWDGKDLCPLSPSDRKKVTDFYSRTSLTAYCSAFAYRPLNRTVDKKLSQIYLELPSDSKHLYMSQRSPTPLHWDFKKGALGQFHSTDSLLYNDKEESVCNVEGCFEMQCNQIFIGMVTMQYQAQSDMVQLIERLERACIRFVHFSKENELRSRVFSEKMGLESGWNCHISLLSEKPNTPECWANNGTTRVWSPSAIPLRVVNRYSESDKNHQLEEIDPLLISSNLESSKPISQSAPSAINMEYSVVKFDEDAVIECGSIAKDSPEKDSSTAEQKDTVAESEEISEKDSIMLQSIDLSSHQEGWPSLSCLTDSTEQSAPVNFDMSNRAKLPRGIENIRPHLEAIDNVPLLVSLFTDCTAGVTSEMLHIMQDYDQTVCVVGSAANADNIEVFMQADASIAVEPLYPQVCQRIPVFTPVAPVHGPSPIGLSRTLNSLPCSLSFRREDPVSLFHLLLEARHYMLAFWNCVQFWVCAMVTISSLQLATIMVLLPPLLTIGQVLWLICVIVPVLTTSLIGIKTDPAVMQRPAGKFNYTFNMEMAYFVLWCYCGKCFPLIVFVILIYGSTLLSLCNNIAIATNNTSCTLAYPTLQTEDNIFIGWDNHVNHLYFAQHIATFVIVIILLAISITFVLREQSIWQKFPNNKLWYWAVLIIIILQITYTALGLTVFNTDGDGFDLSVTDISWFIFPLSFAAPTISFAIVEFIKHKEIKLNLRYLRRARLDFGTKLGMNSPF